MISFWHTRIQASKSALKAMLVNRVGDVGLALGICVSFLTFKTVDYALTFALIPNAVNKSFIFLVVSLTLLLLSRCCCFEAFWENQLKYRYIYGCLMLWKVQHQFLR